MKQLLLLIAELGKAESEVSQSTLQSSIWTGLDLTAADPSLLAMLWILLFDRYMVVISVKIKIIKLMDLNGMYNV